jgi:AAA domain
MTQSTIAQRLSVKKPQPATTPATKPAESVPNTSAEKTPWGPVSQVFTTQGLNALIFGPPGSGKTTFGASATNSPDYGAPLLLLNFDGDIGSLGDRDDIMTWPRDGKIKGWSHAAAFLSSLARRSHPFKTILFDTVNSMYDLAYKSVIESGNPSRDKRQIYGDANDKVLAVIREWAMYSRENGLNVVFICHSEERQDGEDGPIYLRPSITPGVIKGVYQCISTVGCLIEMPGIGHKRKLYLHNTAKIVAKVHQPKTGAQLPLEIVQPDLGRMIEHVKKVRSYPTKENTK